MGFFDFMKKKKEPTHDQMLQVVYEAGFKEPFNSLLFPNGTRQLDKIISSLAKITNVNLDNREPMQYLELAKMYSEVYTFHVVSKSTNNYMMSDLQKRHPDMVKDRNTARRVMIFSMLHMEDHEFSLDTTENLSKFSGMEYLLIENEKIAIQNDKIASRFIRDDDYGLVKEKPVYADGAAGIDRYLASLLTTNGDELTWSRVNVHKVEGVDGLVDEYQGRLPSGEIYKSVFCNLYANNNSDVIPKGFTRKAFDQMYDQFLEGLKK